ncbi:MAG TPA: hypothetical protein PKD51_06320 [Saprospiraceae bacterium]|nr:hypothetical protein [Saprospiraceae bacterium]HMU03030.1 hypothetical protein [Saprospiraceae bacterium]
MVKNKNISAILQGKLLQAKYPEGCFPKLKDNEIIFIVHLQSNPLGEKYKVKIHYKSRKFIDVFVLEPKPLNLAVGSTKLPHVHCQKSQKLCLYYHKYKEWDGKKRIISTIIPWTLEWLYYYEIWQFTGEWLGGGIEH